MSDEYSAIYFIVTSFIPQMIIGVFLPMFLVLITINFMRRPHK